MRRSANCTVKLCMAEKPAAADPTGAIAHDTVAVAFGIGLGAR